MSDSLSIQAQDAVEFREQTLPLVCEVLDTQLATLQEILRSKDPRQLQLFILQIPDEINKRVLDTNNITPSTDDTAIMHDLGMVIWRKPENIQDIETQIVHDLVAAYFNGEMDLDRLGKGIYFLEVLLHKYSNGNGRVARCMQLLFDNTRTGGSPNDETIRTTLGIDKTPLTQTGQNTFKINFNHDFERLTLGVAYFGLYRGLSQDEVVNQLKLNGKMPEQGLEDLTTRLGVNLSTLKTDFIRFITIESDLSWCIFDQANA